MEIKIKETTIDKKKLKYIVEITESLEELDSAYGFKRSVEESLVNKLVPQLVREYEKPIMDAIDVEHLIKRVQLALIDNLIPRNR